jgi:glycosyltransferase involved in cell wall biosynthesis
VRTSILHVAQPVDAGVARCVAVLAADQVRRGWQVTVACPSDGRLHDDVEAVGANHVHWLAWRPPGPRVFGEVRRLARILRSVDPEIVHLHSSKAGLAGRLALRGTRPTIFQPHAWSFDAAEGIVRSSAVAWERFGARWADAVVCVSEAEKQRGIEHGIEARWRVVPNGVDLEALSEASAAQRAAARERLALPRGPLVVCVGRLSRQKGQDVLLSAWPSVTRRVPDAELFLVGSGPEEQRLKSMAPSGVHFAGERDDVEEWLAAANLVVLPSRWEGLSIGLLEALARGRSVVATDVPGAAEALGTEAGAIVPVEDTRALGDEVTKRLLDPSLVDAEGRAARRRAERSYDLDRATAGIAALYAELSSSRATRIP